VKKAKTATEELAYPCAKCGTYNLPYMHSKEGYAFMRCSKCTAQYKTSTAVSANFRRFCSKLGSAPNRDPHYYTSSEERVQRFLERRGLKEGLDYFHNSRVAVEMDSKRRYFWPDFVIPSKKLIIGASPHIWHQMWARNHADDRFTAAMKLIGWEVINLDEKDLQQLNKRRTEGKKLGFNPKAQPYHRTENYKKLDSYFGKPQKGGKTIKQEGENS